MATRNVIINFLTKLQSKGIDKLNKQTNALNKGFKNLAGGLAGFLSLRQISRLAQQSTKAFIEEDKAVRLLATNLKNLNISYDVDAIEGYIDALQRSSGVADDQLRPAFQQLLISTKSVTESQKLLGLALNISAGTGNSLTTVTKALTKSYLGSNTALSRLNVGISKADLSSKKFNEITADLSKRFKGSASAAADTYAGKMDKLKISADEAQEMLGQKLVTAVEMLLDSENGIPGLSRRMEKAAESVGNFTIGIAVLLKQLDRLPGGSKSRQKAIELVSPLQVRLIKDLYQRVEKLGANSDKAAVSAQTLQYQLVKQFQALEDQVATAKQLKKAEADRAKAAAKIAADKAKAKAKEMADARAEALRNRLEGKFDIENINLAAAAQRNLSESDRARVEALQALKTEGVKDDEAALNKLIELEKKREEEIFRQGRSAIFASETVKNQRLADLQAELDALNKIGNARLASITGQPVRTDLSAMSAASAYVQGTRNIGVAGGAGFLDFLFSGETVNPTGMAPLNAAAPGNQSVVVNQYISGNVTTERELFDNYVDAIFQINRQGTNSQLVNLGR